MPRREKPAVDLSRRERQIMRAVYRQGRATVAEIVASLPDPPSPDSIRRMCHILEDKGHLRSVADGARRVYRPTVARGRASRHALADVIDTFFSGSPHLLVATLLDTHRDQLSPQDVARLRRMIEDGEET